MDWVSVMTRLVLAGVFAVAAASKLRDRAGTRETLRQFGVPQSSLGLGAAALPALELIVAAGLLFAATARVAAALAAALLLVFIVAMERVIRSGKAVACHCFGALSAEPVTRAAIARNAVLVVLALAAFVTTAPALDDWFGDRSVAELLAIVFAAWAIVATIGCVVLWRRGRQAAKAAPAIGAPAPAFSLRDLAGRRVDAESLLTPGTPHLLTFVSENCPHCDDLLPQLARWQVSLDEQLPILILGSGRRDHHLEVARQLGLRNVYAQKDFEVAEAFGVRGTPSVVLIDAEGNIGSEPIAGAIGVEAVVRYALRAA